MRNRPGKSQACSFLMDLSSLTRIQTQAVRHRGGPLIVLAGPGTGKTRTLTYRIAHLISSGICRPNQILAVTFTNKAAEEMISRIGELGRGVIDFSSPWVSTFHGFCFRFLQEHLTQPFQLLSETEALNLLRKIVGEQFPDFPSSSLTGLSRRISWAKNTLVFSDEKRSIPDWDVYPNWSFCYHAYQEKLKSDRLMDFDELLLKSISLLEENPEIKNKLQPRFPFIFVDEFQDINPSQYRLFRLMIQNTGEWMVIGDPNQSIYGFRGAQPVFFSFLRQEYPSVTELTLDETFRLNRIVLSASSQVLKGSSGNTPINLISRLHSENKISVVGLSTAEEEAEYISRVIEEEMGGLSFTTKSKSNLSPGPRDRSRSFADFAVLYRLHKQGELLAKVFTQKGIPFKKIQEKHWVEEPEVREYLVLLKNLPPGDITPQEALEICFRKRNQGSQGSFAENTEAVKKLRLWAATFQGTLNDFIELLSIQTGLDTYEPDQETVKLLTLHAVKGLEFPEVIIAGCEENLLPLTMLRESDPEEERRLFYVGLTRAMEKIRLTWAKNRILFGRKYVQSPSVFLDDISFTLKEVMELQVGKSARKPRKKQLSLFS